MPVVVNAKGRKPNETAPHEVYVGRHTRNGWRKSKWGNPFMVPRNAGQEHRDQAVAMYRDGYSNSPTCWRLCPSFAEKILSAGAPRKPVMVTCSSSSPTDRNSNLPKKLSPPQRHHG